MRLGVLLGLGVWVAVGLAVGVSVRSCYDSHHPPVIEMEAGTEPGDAGP